MIDIEKSATAVWQPPTPKSTFTPLPSLSSTLPVDHLVLLPPPLFPHDHGRVEHTFTTSPDHVPLSPNSDPLADSPEEKDDVQDGDWIPTTAPAKRPRRSAAIAAARNIPRQPSPFDLEELDEEDDLDAEVDGDSPSASPPPSGSRLRTGGSNASSRRKVSHSMIERRRREKINECLTTLRETVPDLKEEGERKIARAKERGRKRGRGSDAGERGGLHKLEILQGTIQYIERLRSRVNELESSSSKPRQQSHAGELTVSITSTSQLGTDGPGKAAVKNAPLAPPLIHAPSFSSAGTPDDHEASLLLLEFSTSPELRPVLV